MICQAIIAEYNPFHNGHQYLIEAATKNTNADYTVALMSGNFLQRGQAAMWDKYTRAAMCISSGIDLALELPFPFATGSAFDFANASISILNKLNCIDYLCFGAETDNIDCLFDLSDILINEPSGYSLLLKNYLSSGMSYPSARQAAIETYTNEKYMAEILNLPNNILAIEYINAIRRTQSAIKPIIIKRAGSGYHDINLSDSLSSASAIRAFLCDNIDNSDSVNKIEKVKDYIPTAAYKIMLDNTKNYTGVIPADILPFLQSAILSFSRDKEICDLSGELANKLTKLNVNCDYRSIIDNLKTKNITEARICRSLLHLIFDYSEADRNIFKNDGYAYYANILSINKSNTKLVNQINEKSAIPLITKKADFYDYFNRYPAINLDNAVKMWRLDTKATALYNCLIYNRYGYKAKNDYTTRLPII